MPPYSKAFEEYWQANLLSRYRGVMGMNEEQLKSLKIIAWDIFQLGVEKGEKTCAPQPYSHPIKPREWSFP